MMTLKLDGRNIEVLDAYMVNDDEGGLVLGFVANINDLLPKDLLPFFTNGMRFVGHIEAHINEADFNFDGVIAVHEHKDELVTLTVRYM